MREGGFALEDKNLALFVYSTRTAPPRYGLRV
jgi:hypothetical protein